MALKRKIDKAAFDQLSDELKKEYKEKDGAYVLDTDDATELERALERTKQEAKEEKDAREKAEKEAKDLKAKLEDESTATARKKGDIEALEKSWKDKNDKLEQDYKKTIEGRDAFITKHLADNIASDMASKISTKPALLLPHIRGRITVDFDGTEPKTRILDKDGKPSSMTVEDLSKEFVANKDFADIMVGSKASGSNASGGNTGANGSKKFAEMNDAERKEFYTRDPAGFKAASDADKAAARGYDS